MSAKSRTLIHFVVLCFILSACRISGLVLQLPSQNQTSSSAHALTLDLLSQNIEAEVEYLARNPRIELSEAKLVLVFVVSRRARSSNIADFQQISLAFRTGGPPVPYGLDKYFFVSNLPPRRWSEWTPPRFHSGATALDTNRDIAWSRVQTSMSIQRADTLLKAAGYRGDFTAVQIAETRHEPLGFCFHELEVLPGFYRAVIVDVLTGMVRELDLPICP